MSQTSKIDLDSSYDETDEPPPKRPLLESVGRCFQQNRIERQNRIAVEESKRQTEKVHAKFIKENMTCPVEMMRADYVVSTWAKINGVKAEPKRKRNISSKLNSQTVTSNSQTAVRNQISQLLPESPIPRSSATKSTLTGSRSPVDRVKKSASGPGAKSRNPSPSDVLNISDLSIGTQNSAKSKNCSSHGFDCDTDTLLSSNKNQSSSGSDRSSENQSSSKSVNQSSSKTVNRSSSKTVNQSSSQTVNQSSSKQGGSDQQSETSTNENLDDSLIIVSDKAPSASSPHRQFTCRVLHCETVFTSQTKLHQHMNLFRHSPCNPCLRAKDGKLLPDPICYMCPECDQDFKTTAECRDHMRGANHLPYLPPLRIAGYICPQCLAIFESFETCWDHISELSHRFVSYPFLDDLNGPQPPEIGPIAIPEELAMDFIDKCNKVPFKVQCLECSLEMETALMLRQHMAETNRQHPVSSLAESNPVDIFADYLAEFRCSSCYRLFTKYMPTHYCARGVQGTVIENNVKSFYEFVKSCALTLTPVDPESSSSTDCAQSTQRPSLHLENLIQVIHHSPDKGAIPKIPQSATANKSSHDYSASVVHHSPTNQPKFSQPAVANKSSHDHSPNVKKSQNKKLENSETDIIVLDSPPRSSQSNTKTSPTMEQIKSKDEEVNKRMKQRLDSGANGAKQTTDQLAGACFQEQEIPGPSSEFVCTTKFQNFAYTMTTNCPKSSTEVNKGYVPDVVEPGGSHHRPRHEDEREARKSQRSPVGAPPERAESESHRERSRSPTRPHATSTENLRKMKNIIFLDLDNWPGFFSKLPRRLPDFTFVWGFYGGKVVWKEPNRCFAFSVMKSKNLFYLHDRCGHTKDAADFAIVLTVGQMHERLPKHIPFTIVSGDKGFIEVERQMRDSNRNAVVIDPHSAQQFSQDMIYTMVTSVSDT